MEGVNRLCATPLLKEVVVRKVRTHGDIRLTSVSPFVHAPKWPEARHTPTSEGHPQG